MALVAVDQRLVKDLQDVAFHLIEAEAAHMRQNAAHQRFAIGVRHDPIEEIAFRRAHHAGGFEGGAGKHAFGIVFAQIEHRQRDGLGDDHQKGVLEEQLIVLDILAIDQLQKLRPELTLERHGRLAFHLLPERGEHVTREPVGDGVLSQLRAHGERIGRQRTFQSQRAVQPSEELFALVGIEGRFLYLDERIVLTLEHHPFQAV